MKRAMKDGASFNMMYGYPFDRQVRLMNMKKGVLRGAKKFTSENQLFCYDNDVYGCLTDLSSD